MNNTLTIFAVFIIGIIFFTVSAGGASLSTPVEMNKLKTFDIPVTSTETLIGMDWGTATTISSVELTFRNALAADTTVSISIKDSSGTEIGSGSKTLTSSASIVTVSLSDTITVAEKPTIRKMTVTT